MTTFAEDEASVAHSRIIEFYDIVLSSVPTPYRLAAGNRDLQVGSNLYVATPALRTELVAPQVDGSGSSGLTLSLPIDHAIVKRWFQGGVPPRKTTVTAWRKQERSAALEQQWIGLVTSMSCEGTIAKLLIPAQIVANAQKYLPTVTTQQTCPYILYDKMCQVDRTLFKVATTAILVEGRDVRIDIGDAAKIGQTVPWTLGGELLHVASGERMPIVLQTDADPASGSTITTLSMQLPLPDLKTGDAIEVYAGCDHSIQTCKTKFANQTRFGGYPDAALTNFFLPGGSGLGLGIP